MDTTLPQTVLDRVVEHLAGVPGVAALALGGSRGRGDARPDADVDVGLTYRAEALDLAALDAALTALDDDHRPGLLNPPGAWGPWVNGGAWTHVAGLPVDILLREAGRVEAVIHDCLAGRITIDYQAGHPFGFVNAIYAAEVHHCRPLWQDATRPLDALKALLHTEGEYPPRMRAAICGRFLWEAEFSLATGRKAALGGDVHYAMGCAFRAVGAWAQVLYALNRRYLMNEKGALPGVRTLPHAPEALEARAGRAYALLAGGQGEEAWALLEALHAEVTALASDAPGRAATI